MSAVCSDCGVMYGPTQSLDEHLQVCEARTCECCENTYNCVIPENDRGERVCVGCQADLDEVDMAYDSEEEMEGGD